MAIDGILNVDKPKGETSFAVVAVVRRLSGERRVGHAGTLDPEATGVLPICVGAATRVVEYLAESGKTYRAEIQLGTSTDTYDATGKVTGRGDISKLTADDIRSAAASFVGQVEQIPPMFSAVKYRGVRLYRWARAGVVVPREARKVEFHRLDILRWKPPLVTAEVECGKGAYMRSLAQDLGERLGCGGHLSSLVRLRSGPFCISEAVSLAEVGESFRGGYWLEVLRPTDTAVQHFPQVVLDHDQEMAVINGRGFAAPEEVGGSPGMGRAYSRDGRFVAVVCYDEETGSWRPRKVFAGRRGKA